MTTTVQDINQFLNISTHTLTWSVTNVVDVCFIHKFISTHTLTWSVTILSDCISYTYEISTHTLTWSVTRFEDNLEVVERDFNSHAHVERDALVLTFLS